MRIFSGQASPVQLQWLIWGFVFIINFISLLPMDGVPQSAAFTIVNTGFYAIIIYGNLHFLLPVFYREGRLLPYVFFSLLFLALVGISKSYLSQYLYNRFFAEEYTPMNARMLIYTSVTGIVVYVLSFVFRFALGYFKLKQQAEEIIAQKSQAELNLLKSQVQPHFLFNTLNNIYYEAYREAPRTAIFIERLSEIMRYFVDESPKEEVTLGTEIQFLENYIALERIRIRHEVDISFTQQCQPGTGIPPMLLMTFVENIFKHGIDKSSSRNEVHISLLQQDGYLVFRTRNLLHPAQAGNNGSGFGIQNLQKRLALLYGAHFELKTYAAGQYFNAFLKIPLS
ncbi:sensor histidine kinase [Chitinophaga japonensis]|uniref:Histidine kinase n=1 Tax=Chitinophaga japonensis TaxID=104662 RepID=A0A562STD4_CHIJA|nr:sensor histidine kinase [Chitinophaga japonensis]TWI84056.1 histidine kinase [Chitinophaga japonensis]